MVQDELDERLKNWAWYVSVGFVGPETRTRAASAEGEYVSDDVWEGEDPKYEPDMVDGQLLEDCIRVLPDISRRVLKAKYVSFPYFSSHNVAQRLRMSVDKLEAETAIAKRRLSERICRATIRSVV